jgi:hypothetical protein
MYITKAAAPGIAVQRAKTVKRCGKKSVRRVQNIQNIADTYTQISADQQS